MSSEPIVNAPNLYVNGLQIAFVAGSTPGDTFTVNPGAARDSTNTYDIIVNSAITVSNAVTGVNGVDTGTIQNNAWYAVYLLGDPTGYKKPCCVITEVTTAPIPLPALPPGYGSFRRIGWVKTDGSSLFLSFYQRGNGDFRQYEWDVEETILNLGGSTTFLAVDCTAGSPPLAGCIYLNCAFTPTTAGNIASVRTTGSLAAASQTPIVIEGQVNGERIQISNQRVFTRIIPAVNGIPSIDYAVTGGTSTLSLAIFGYDDYL